MAVDLVWRRHDPVGHEQPAHDLQIAAPSRRFDHAGWLVPGPAAGRRARHRLGSQRHRIVPVQRLVGELGRHGQLEPAGPEQGRSQRGHCDRMGLAAAAEMHHRRTAVKADHAVTPQEVQQVGVVGVPEERLRVRAEDLGVQVAPR